MSFSGQGGQTAGNSTQLNAGYDAANSQHGSMTPGLADMALMDSYDTGTPSSYFSNVQIILNGLDRDPNYNCVKSETKRVMRLLALELDGFGLDDPGREGFTVAYPKAPSLFRKSPECTGQDFSISVKCPFESRREANPLALNNRSSCCFFSVYNSSHSNEACAVSTAGEQGTMSTKAKNSESTAISDSNSYLLRTCEGSDVRLLCELNASSCGNIIRWRSVNGKVIARRSLPLSNVHREDAGTYTCEVTDAKGEVKQTGLIRVEVQFAPVIIVPNSSVSIWTESEDVLECQSEASPRSTITWYRDGILLAPSPSLYTISSESRECRTTSYVFFKARNNSSFGSEDVVLENYTCLAENELGKSIATFLIASFIEDSSNTSDSGGRRRFNVTGFIVGMLPPLLISFYIILKLGYRSRYAEERGEDDGFREEPFFISY